MNAQNELQDQPDNAQQALVKEYFVAPDYDTQCIPSDDVECPDQVPSSGVSLVHGSGSQTSVGLTGVSLPSSGSIFIDAAVLFTLAVGLYATKHLIDKIFDR